MNIQSVRKTRLHDKHVEMGARMVPFAGWEMPVQYPTRPIEEHNTVRKVAGLFDIDHMGQLEVRGPDALPYLQKMVTCDVSKIKPWETGYAHICYHDGGIVDDIFIYNLPGRYFIAINASHEVKDYQWLKQHTHGFDVEMKNISEETYMLALQGPKAQEILQKLTEADLSKLPFHMSAEDRVAGVLTLISASGYTGEYGYELYFPAEKAEVVWDSIMEAGRPLGLKPIGLAARDSLRFEPSMPLYGQEISQDINSIEAQMNWAVSFEKGDFIGRDALLKTKLEGPKRKLVGFEMVERSVPRHGYTIAVEGKEVGFVTSGMYSPTTGKFLGLGYVPSEYAPLGTEIRIIIRGKPKKAKVVRRPFYVPPYRRK